MLKGRTTIFLVVGFVIFQILLLSFFLSKPKNSPKNEVTTTFNTTFEPLFHSCSPMTNLENRYVKMDICLSDDPQKQEEQIERALRKCPYTSESNGLVFEASKDGYTIDFSTMFDVLMEYIKCQIPFAFTRWGDGEYDLIVGHKIRKTEQAFYRDKFSWEGGQSKLGVELKKALGGRGNYFYGFPCPDVWRDKLIGFLSFPELKQPMKYISYSWMTVKHKFINYLDGI